MRLFVHCATVAMAAGLLAAAPAWSRPSATASSAAATATGRTLQDEVQSGIDKSKKEDYLGASLDFDAAVHNPDFAQAPADARFALYMMLGAAQARSADRTGAYDSLTKAGAASPATRNAYYWAFYANVAAETDHADVAIDALIHLVEDQPADAKKILDNQMIGEVLRAAGRHPELLAKRRQFLEGLIKIDYTPDNPFQSAEWLHFDLFEIYAEAGDDAKAKALLDGLVEPGTIQKLRVDKRFTRFIAADPTRFDYAKAFDAGIVRDRKLIADHPDKVEGINRLANDLLQGNHLDEALSLVDNALARANAKGGSAFSDLDEQLNWTFDTRTRILAKFGRWDEVEAAQVKARDYALLHQHDLVSQKINLGDYEYEIGKPQAALDEVKDVGAVDASPYGLMAAQEVRACAYAQLKDQANLTKVMDFMKAHADDAYPALRNALLCTGDTDALAAQIIKRLDDPDTRVDMLIDLQTYLPSPRPSEVDKAMNAVDAAAKARPDVRAAVAKYGVIESYPVFSPES